MPRTGQHRRTRCDDRLVATEVKLDASDADQVVRHLAELLVVAVDGEREVAGHPIVCIWV
eukprot:752155-Hanusia_phi.AAC.3